MADTDLLPSRGVTFEALVDSTGIAINGSSTVAQLAAKGMRAACAVDGTGTAITGGGSLAQIAAAGIRAFCAVDQNGVAQDSSTADQLRSRGIRPRVLLDATGVALNGSAGQAVLASRGLTSFCPVDESGNATTMGAVILISNTNVFDNIAVGATVGTLSVAGGSGTYTFTLPSNPGAHFATAGTNGVNLNTATALTAGSYPVTVQAAGGVPTPISRALSITVNQSPTLPANTALPVISGSTSVGSTLTTTNGTWTGFPPPGFTYQWKRGGSAISGATSNTYLLVSADTGTTITVTVTATNSAGNAGATSAGVGPITAPAVVYPPLTCQAGLFTLTGEDMTPIAGYVLTANGATGVNAFVLAGQSANLIPPVGAASTIWSSTDKGPDFIISGTPALTATTNATISQSEIVRGTVSHSTGKYYFEYHLDFLNTFTSCGIANAAHGLTGVFLGGDLNGMCWLPNGVCYINVIPINLQAFTVGDRLGLAFDFTAKKFWGSVNGGNWNNDVIANQNPATGVGGRDLSTMAAGPYFPAAFDNNTTGQITANFGQTAYGTAAPSGFGNW